MRQPLHVFELLLVPEFPLYAVIPVIEALRIANQNAGRKLFDWSFVSTQGGAVRSCNGMTIETTEPVALSRTPECVIVCSGNEPTQHLTPVLLNWLRRLAAHGSTLGALDTGAFALATAGVMAGYQFTLHWEAVPAFRQAFPRLRVLEQIFVIDRTRITSAGGTAALDMILDVIGFSEGPELAAIVADGFVHGRGRVAGTPQRQPVDPAQSESSLLTRCVDLMRSRLEFPLAIDELCDQLAIPRRQLERVLRRQVGCAPAELYRDIRLDAAKEQLFYTTNAISQIAGACGFPSHAHFCRAFRSRFQISPTDFRRRSCRTMRERFHLPGATSRPDRGHLETMA